MARVHRRGASTPAAPAATVRTWNGGGEWEHLDHGADIGVRGYGETLAQAFEQVAIALTAVVTDVETVAPTEVVEITCEASDLELLLVEWLNALIYEMATRHMLFSRFVVHIEGADNDAVGPLYAAAWGEPVEPARHHPAVEVKGATLTELVVDRDAAGRWRAQCVVDV